MLSNRFFDKLNRVNANPLLCNQDYNHKLAQTRAGRSSKSKLQIAKFSQGSSLEGWELREGTYFVDDVSVKYDGGMDAQLEVAEDGNAVFSGLKPTEQNSFMFVQLSSASYFILESFTKIKNVAMLQTFVMEIVPCGWMNMFTATSQFLE